MRIVTWNVNGIRPRLGHLGELVKRYDPDIVCCQETKVDNDNFPEAAIRELGFKLVAFHGQKSYNGVCILAREDLGEVSRRVFTGKDDCRHIALTLPDGLEIHNFYIPAGGDMPDREANPKFEQKMGYLEELETWFPETYSTDKPLILLGDLNVAPLENDVWNHKPQSKYVGHTPGECAQLLRTMEAHGWIDVGRKFVPPSEKLHTWWTYRGKELVERGRGWRLDHIWATPPLASRLNSFQVATDIRLLEKPSDHAPVILDLDD